MEDSSDFASSDSDKSEWDANEHFVSNPVEGDFNTLRTRSFKLFKHPFPGFLTILTL